jgi:antitoxin component HigA of HigAB toxin-antitoxin module
MASAGLSPAGLGDIIGSRPAASMFLSGTRKELSKTQIRRLAAHFKVNAGYFL